MGRRTGTPRLHSAGIVSGQPVDKVAWQSLQLLTRRDIADAAALLQSSNVPPEHGSEPHTDLGLYGSTGCSSPFRLDQLMAGDALRDHAWHKRDLSGRLCALRAT